MKGLILVGGLGTQLRPLTLTKAKPLIDFGNKPQLRHLLELLKHAGVTEVVLAINYRPEIMADFLENNDDLGVKITLSQEREPLGAEELQVAHEVHRGEAGILQKEPLALVVLILREVVILLLLLGGV